MHISVEFFPPANAKGREQLLATASRMLALRPEYFSVTYGADSSVKGKTFEAVKSLVEGGLNIVPHISFGTEDEQSIHDLLQSYQALDICHVLALRGDQIDSQDPGRNRNKVRYAADLVRFIRSHYGDHFHIQVAAYPESHPDSPTPEDDLFWLKEKVEAGANGAVTQYFYNCDAYENFLERCAKVGITTPIVPGIMPITNYHRLVGFSKRCGAEIPLWILKQMAQYQDDPASLYSFGIEVVTQLCDRLSSLKVPGMHFYSMNRSDAVMAICTNINLISEN